MDKDIIGEKANLTWFSRTSPLYLFSRPLSMFVATQQKLFLEDYFRLYTRCVRVSQTPLIILRVISVYFLPFGLYLLFTSIMTFLIFFKVYNQDTHICVQSSILKL